MTSRQSGWRKPGDAQGSSAPGWGTNQLPGHFHSGAEGSRLQGWDGPVLAGLLHDQEGAPRLCALLTCNQLLHGSSSL